MHSPKFYLPDCSPFLFLLPVLTMPMAEALFFNLLGRLGRAREAEKVGRTSNNIQGRWTAGFFFRMFREERAPNKELRVRLCYFSFIISRLKLHSFTQIIVAWFIFSIINCTNHMTSSNWSYFSWGKVINTLQTIVTSHSELVIGISFHLNYICLCSINTLEV